MNIQIFGMKKYYDIASKRGKFEACQSVDDFIHQKLVRAVNHPCLASSQLESDIFIVR